MVDGIVDWLKSIWEGIKSIPTLILDGIKAIFVPDPQVVENKFEAILDDVNARLGVDMHALDRLQVAESIPTDKNVDYNIPGLGTMNLKILDTDYLIQGVAYFRPYIRGFMVFLLLLFHVRMFMSFINQEAGIAAGHLAREESKKGGSDS